MVTTSVWVRRRQLLLAAGALVAAAAPAVLAESLPPTVTVEIAISSASSMETQMRDANKLEAAKGRTELNSADALCDVEDLATHVVEKDRTLHLAWAKNGPNSISLFCNAVTDSCVGVRHLYNGAVIKNIRGKTDLDKTALTSSGDYQVNGIFFAGLGANDTTTIRVRQGGSDVGASQCLDQIQQLGAGYSVNTDTNLATDASGKKVSAASSTVAPIQVSGQSAVTEIYVGATPVVVFVNKTLSDPALAGSLENLTTDQLRNIFYGVARDWNTIDGSGIGLLNNSAVASLPIIAVHREPPSGTYNTFEQDVMASGGGSQEMLKSSAGDPGRVFGSGNMIKAVAYNAGAIGYTFYSPGAFATDGDKVKYLKINGVDPLGQPSYSGDMIGITPNYTRVKNGSYPIWSAQRVIFAKKADQLTPSEQSWLNTLRQSPGTYIPFSDMKVTRSHRVDPFGAPSNGTSGGVAAGNDSGGLVVNIGDDVRIGGNGATGLRQ